MKKILLFAILIIACAITYAVSDEYSINGIRSIPVTGTLELTGSMEVTDDDWIGFSSSTGRIEFDDQSTDEINLMTANIGINDSTPSYLLDVNGKASLCSTTKSVSSTPVTLTADEVKNATIFVSFASTITLPAGASALDGACTTFQSTAAVVFSVEAGASDLIVLNGTALDDGDKITSSGVAGETVTVVWDHTGDRWRTIGLNGVFIDGGA